jgi:PAS domain S-box-containing protein
VLTTDTNSDREAEKTKAYLRLVIDTIPTLAWSAGADGSAEFFNQRWLDYTGLSPEEARGWGWKAAIHPEDVERIMERWRAILMTASPAELEGRLLRSDGVYRWFLFRATPSLDEFGRVAKWFGTNTDIEDRRRVEALRDAEKRTLEIITDNESLDDILNELCHSIDAQASAAFSTILLMEPGGKRLWYAAGPLVPRAWLPAINPRPVGPNEGCCGAAAFLKERVIVADVLTDPLWQPDEYRELAVQNGIRAAWSQPIMTKHKEVLGTFALYSPNPRIPTDADLELIEGAGHIALIAIERKRVAEAREAAVIGERNRVARDIHDTLAQGFTGIIMQLEAARGATKRGDLVEATNRVERASKLARASLGEARRTVWALRPPSLRNGKLFSAINDLLNRMTEGTDLNACFQGQGDEGSIPIDCEEALLRITQESLTNTIRHAPTIEANMREKIKSGGASLGRNRQHKKRAVTTEKRYLIRVLIADDHSILRDGLVAIIKQEADMEVVAETGDGQQAVKLWQEYRPDITLMDLRMPGLDGVKAIYQIRGVDPNARIIVLTTYDGDEDIYRGMRAGAKSYLLKDVRCEELFQCIRQVHVGQAFLPPEIAAKLAGRMPAEELTSREMDVLRLLAEGKPNKLIAADLSISEVTVKSHVLSLFRKLNVLSRTEAIAVAHRKGLLRL